MQQQVHKLYQLAYGDRIEQIDLEVFAHLLDGLNFANTRAMVKGLIEALDVSRFGTYSPEDEW